MMGGVNSVLLLMLISVRNLFCEWDIMYTEIFTLLFFYMER